MSDLPKNESKTLTANWRSSMDSIRLTKNTNNTYEITFIEDEVHGYRSFTLSEKDFLQLLQLAEF